MKRTAAAEAPLTKEQEPSVYHALVEVRDLSLGDETERKRKRAALRANPERIKMLARIGCLKPTFKALLQASLRFADNMAPEEGGYIFA